MALVERLVERDERTGRSPPHGGRGRGASSNRSGRFEREERSLVDDGWARADPDDLEPKIPTEIAVDASRSILTRNRSPDVPFDRSVNMYRGCEHGCVYCFARPSHAYLGLSPGLDFETKIFIKPDAARLLRAALDRPGYRAAPIAIGTNTDPYQPIEKSQRLMRGVLEVLAERRHPVTIVTKGALIARDVDLLGAMAAEGLCRAALSVTTLDRRLARAMEPRASTPARRLAAIETLAAAGVPVGVMVAPIVPGLTDHETEAILSAARDAGARRAEYVLLRLPREVAELMRDWLAEAAPDRARRVMRLVRETQGGRDYDPQWGKRMRGEGPIAEMIARRFKAARKRLALDATVEPLRTDLFTPARSGLDGQLALDL